MSKEFIDGFGEASFQPQEELAFKAYSKLIGCMLAQRATDHIVDDNFRLTSWVEQSDSKLGYALALSRPYEPDSAPANLAMAATFYTIDREHHTFASNPKDITVEAFITQDADATENSIRIQTEKIAQDFDASELELVLNMLGKAQQIFTSEAVHRLDRDILLTLSSEQIDILASLYPTTETPLETTLTAESVFKHPQIITHLSERLQKEEDSTQIYLRHIDGDVVYYLAFETDGAIITSAIFASQQNPGESHTCFYDINIPEEDTDTSFPSEIIGKMAEIIDTGKSISVEMFHSRVAAVQEDVFDEAYALGERFADTYLRRTDKSYYDINY
jgi:hypothetical protein